MSGIIPARALRSLSHQFWRGQRLTIPVSMSLEPRGLTQEAIPALSLNLLTLKWYISS